VLLVTGPVTSNMREALERTYDATPDGRILSLRSDIGPDGRPVSPQIQVVFNWIAELKQRLPASQNDGR